MFSMTCCWISGREVFNLVLWSRGTTAEVELRCRYYSWPKFCKLIAKSKHFLFDLCFLCHNYDPFIRYILSFQRHFQTEKESQSFSLIYANGERSLHLVWFCLFTTYLYYCYCIPIQKFCSIIIHLSFSWRFARIKHRPILGS